MYVICSNIIKRLLTDFHCKVGAENAQSTEPVSLAIR